MSKPHIMPIGGGQWLCTRVGDRVVAVGVGDTPRQAHTRWLDNCMTEMMRASHPHLFVTRNPPVRLSDCQLLTLKF